MNLHQLQVCLSSELPTLRFSQYAASRSPFLGQSRKSDQNIKLGKYKNEDYWLKNQDTQYNTIGFVKLMLLLFRTIHENMDS